MAKLKLSLIDNVYETMNVLRKAGLTSKKEFEFWYAFDRVYNNVLSNPHVRPLFIKQLDVNLRNIVKNATQLHAWAMLRCFAQNDGVGCKHHILMLLGCVVEKRPDSQNKQNEIKTMILRASNELKAAEQKMIKFYSDCVEQAKVEFASFITERT